MYCAVQFQKCVKLAIQSAACHAECVDLILLILLACSFV